MPRLAAVMAFAVVLASCSAPSKTDSGAAPGGAVNVPLASPDPDALAKAENEIKRVTREQAGLAKLGPGAVEFATFMDKTESFLLAQTHPKLRASVGGGRLAARLPGLPSPGETLVGVYAMTSIVFPELVADEASYMNSDAKLRAEDTSTTTKTGSSESTDEVTVEGNKGTIKTTITFTASKVKSKVSLAITMKEEGEVRDAKTGAVLYKIQSEATGLSVGDFCPDTSGIASAFLSFTGQESYFDSAGAKTGTADRSFGGQVHYKADDSAKLVSTEVSGGSMMGQVMVQTIAQATAGPYEKGWRSGACIEVVVDPGDKEVDAGSKTDVTVKLRHKTEGNDLDKMVEAKMTSGTKSIEPSGQKQKAPASFKFTAGEKGEKGNVSFDSTSNRGIGHTGVTYTVAGDWLVNATGSSHERAFGIIDNDLKVTIKDLKVKAGKDGALEGTGTMTITGPVSVSPGGGALCKGQLDQTIPITATGSVVGTSPTAILKLTLHTPSSGDEMVSVKCSFPGVSQTQTISLSGAGHSDVFGETLGEIELPADGGTKTINKTTDIGPQNVTAGGTFTVTKAKS